MFHTTPINPTIGNCGECGNPKRRTPGGQVYCQLCKQSKQRNKTPEELEEVRRKRRKWYEQNNEAQLTWKAQYRDANRHHIQEYSSKYYQDNKDRLSQQTKDYRNENYEMINTQRLGYREANRERLCALQKEYYQQHKDRLLEYAKHFRDNKMHPLYKVWDAIIQRCYNPNFTGFDRYGGRGITMCDRWRESFENFAEDMGPKPTDGYDYSIERKRVNGDYEPGNCKWATAKEQSANTSRSRRNQYGDFSETFLHHNGRKISLIEFGEITGIVPIVLVERYKTHFSPDLILDCPTDNRFYEYNDVMYSAEEASLITGLPFQVVAKALRRENKSIEDLVGK